MGQGFSSGNNIYIQTQQPSYASGDNVQGYVLLNCVTPFECRQITLTFEGYEKVDWEAEFTKFENNNNNTHQTFKSSTTTSIQHGVTTTTTTQTHTNGTGGSHSVTRRVPHASRREFFKVTVPLQTFPQMCMPGQYQLPFSFVLPLNLPGSFDHCESRAMRSGATFHNTRARIKYKLYAECAVPGIFTPNLRHEAYVTLLQRLAKPPSEMKSSYTQEVTKCCCSSQGNATMVANVQKDSYMPGETAAVILQVQNNSTAEFNKVTLSLHKRMKMTADCIGGHHHSNNSRQQLDEKVAEASFPGVEAGVHLEGANARVLQLLLPQNLLPTTMGHLIECEYVLHVSLKAASAIVSDVKLKVPVLVYVVPPAQPIYTQPPPWWNATVVGVPVQLSLPSTPPVAPDVQQMGDMNRSQPQPPANPGQLPAYPGQYAGQPAYPGQYAGQPAPMPVYPGMQPAYPSPANPGMMPAYPQGQPGMPYATPGAPNALYMTPGPGGIPQPMYAGPK